MKEIILNNLDMIDKNRYNELSILLDEEINVKDYFNNEYLSIMNKWKREYSEFDIPNILVGISINGNNSIISNSDVLNNDTIFDIASMSKVYTEMILFDVLEEYNLSFDTKIRDITDMYNNIRDLSIMDLLSFNNTYKTDKDIRKCTNKNDALNALRDVYIIEEKNGYYLYTDLPIMILTDILESITNMSYKELFDKYIVKKYDLNNTYLEIDNDNYLTINKGRVNDPKANIFGGYYGHCGVKATCSDLMKFLCHVISSKYSYLFTSTSKTLDKDGNIKKSKGLIGNSNISVSDDDSLASIYLPSNGFAIQGSVRCHAEICKFIIEDEEYLISSCIFTDLYTQEDNIKKYEKNHDVIISSKITLDDKKTYKMYDIRKILSYDKEYKDIVNLVGKCRVLKLNEFINNK